MVCSPAGVETASIALTMEDLAHGPFARSIEEAISLTVTNRGHSEATVAISAYTLSRHAEHETPITELQLDGREMDVVEIAVADLGLPDQAVENSASLVFRANPRGPDGAPMLSSDLGLYYHPADGGLLFYDGRTWQNDFDNGALTDGARARQAAAADLDLGEHVVVVDTGEWLLKAEQGREEQR